MDIETALNEFLTAKQGAGRSLKTIGWYRDSLAVFINWLKTQNHDARLVYVPPETIDNFLAHERKRLQPATLHGRYRALSSFYGWLAKRKKLGGQSSPIADVEPPYVPPKRQRTAKLQEYDGLVQSIPLTSWVDLRDNLAVTTLFLCGVRVSELIQLRIPDYDLTDRVVTVRYGKGGGERTVPMLDPVALSFATYLYVRPAWPTDEVFLSADGGHRQPQGVLTPNGMRQRLHFLCKRAGMRYLNPHSFRHGLATHLLNAKGADMALIQRVLGHKRLSTTAEIYAKWEIEGVSREYQELMEDVGKKKNKKGA